MYIYLIGSLRNPHIPALGCELRAAGLSVYDDWHAAGPEADDEWKRYEQERGRPFTEAVRGEHARAVWGLDKEHLDACDGALLVMPAGKSAFLELGYVIGQGKPGCILLDDADDRWDVMFRFADAIFTEPRAAVTWFSAHPTRPDPVTTAIPPAALTRLEGAVAHHFPALLAGYYEARLAKTDRDWYILRFLDGNFPEYAPWSIEKASSEFVPRHFAHLANSRKQED